MQNLKGKQNQAMDVKLFDLLLCRCTCERNKLTLQLAFLHTDSVLQTQNLNSAVLSPDGPSADFLTEIIFHLASIISAATVRL